MAKKISYLDRKKMLESQRAGASNTDLKREFNIKDNRTLSRHLEMADQEEQLRTVQIEIIKEAIEAHHKDIRSLVQQWKTNMRTHRPDEIYPNVAILNKDLKDDPIFPCLRDHLPNRTLWSAYSEYERMTEEFFNLCLDLRIQVAQEVEKWGDVEKITDNVAQSILKDIAEGKVNKDKQLAAIKVSTVNTTPDKTVVKADGMDIFTISSHTDIKEIKRLYQKYSYKLVTGDVGTNISALYHKLKDELEPKINTLLQEILHRRDYIMYTCRLCPGQPKLLRK